MPTTTAQPAAAAPALTASGKPAAGKKAIAQLKEVADQVNAMNSEHVKNGGTEMYKRERTEAYSLLKANREQGRVLSQAQVSHHIRTLIACVRTLRAAESGTQPGSPADKGQHRAAASEGRQPRAGRTSGKPVVDDEHTARYLATAQELYKDFAATRNQIGRIQQLVADGFGGDEVLDALAGGLSSPEASERIQALKKLEAEAARAAA
ncbi:MAG: hypothetical protein AB1941_00585 [Gemmatimonadota bacterium]